MTIIIVFIMAFILFWIITVMPLFLCVAEGMGRLESRIEALENEEHTINEVIKDLGPKIKSTFY